MQVLLSMKDGWKYWWRELNKKTWYYKACTRASELEQKWYVKVVNKKDTGWPQKAHQYQITPMWLLQVWLYNDENVEPKTKQSLWNKIYSLIK